MASASAGRVAGQLLFPGGLIVLAPLALLLWPDLAGSTLLLALPWAALAGGLVLGVRFRQVGVALAVALLAVADRTLDAYGSLLLVERAVACLLPLDLLILALRSEGTAIGSAAAARLLFLALPPLALLGLDGESAGRWVEALGRPLVPFPFERATALPPAALILFALALLVLLVRFARRRRPLDAGFLWALTASLLALHLRPHRLSTLYLAAGELALAAALIETSHAMAYRDDLTGLSSRRALDERLASLTGECAIAMVDIDHFKKLNDRHGHDVGDQVLRMVASRLAEVTGGGRPYRYGGEEFAIVFAGIGKAEAMPHLEALRRSIHAAPFRLRAPDRPARKPDRRRPGSARPEVAVTVSIGVADAAAGRRRAEEVIRAADRALYRAKDEGRNRVRG